MKGWYLVIDVEKCENCNNCFLACKDEHVGNDWPGYAASQPDHGQKWMRIQGKERGVYPFIDVAYLPRTCMHCDQAPCIKAAGDGAVYKRPDGIVVIDPVKARGQKALVNACPYGAIEWNEGSELPQKCTFCAHLLDDGWTTTRCVQSCPTGALGLRHMEASEMEALVKAEGLQVYAPGKGTGPRVYYKNLHRFTRCFIGGSVATRVDGRQECVEGAEVTLFDKAHETVGSTLTDLFGDFKFDNLEEGSGPYTLRVSYKGRETAIAKVEPKESMSVGVLFV